MEISEATLYSIVTLTGSYHFKGELPAKVVDIKKLIPYIKCRDTVLLKDDEKERVTKKILYYKSQTTLKKSLQHIVNVRNRENKNYKKNLSVYELFYELILKNRVFLKLVILFLSTLSIYILLNTSGLNLHQNTYSSKIIPIDAINKKIIPQKNNTKEIHPAQPTKFPGAIYSWKNEKGIRVYSNIGFPKNGKYTEGKIEWQ